MVQPWGLPLLLLCLLLCEADGCISYLSVCLVSGVVCGQQDHFHQGSLSMMSSCTFGVLTPGLACRWQEQEDEHAQQLASLMVAQERLQGQLRQGEEAQAIAEQEIARQKGCIGSTRAKITELEHALQQATSQVHAAVTPFSACSSTTAPLQGLKNNSNSVTILLHVVTSWVIAKLGTPLHDCTNRRTERQHAHSLTPCHVLA